MKPNWNRPWTGKNSELRRLFRPVEETANRVRKAVESLQGKPKKRRGRRKR